MTNSIIQAAQFAAYWHGDQKRKFGGELYINHPLRVAGRVSLLPGATTEMVCAAWLHDVCEDCGVSIQGISERFGNAIGTIVAELTNTTKPAVDFPREVRKEIDRERLALISSQAKRIKAVDRIDNLRGLEFAPTDFAKMYASESVLLAGVLRDGIEETLYRELMSECERLSV